MRYPLNLLRLAAGSSTNREGSSTSSRPQTTARESAPPLRAIGRLLARLQMLEEASALQNEHSGECMASVRQIGPVLVQLESGIARSLHLATAGARRRRPPLSLFPSSLSTSSQTLLCLLTPLQYFWLLWQPSRLNTPALPEGESHSLRTIHRRFIGSAATTTR